MNYDELVQELEEYSADANYPRISAEKVERLKEETALSDREAEVYGLRKSRLDNQDIAEILGISKNTVRDTMRKARRRIDECETTLEVVDEIEPDPIPDRDLQQ